MEVLSILFSILCSIVAPVGLTIYFIINKKTGMRSVIVGALTFVIFQVLTRIPLVQIVLPNTSWYTRIAVSEPILLAIFLGVTAALFEEIGRYVMMSLFMKNRSSIYDGILFGIGHGGIEAILFVGINSIAILILQSNAIDASLMFAGGMERISTLMLHISWSLLVMKTVKSRKLIWMMIALVFHAVIDSGVVLLSINGTGTWTIEIILIIVAIGSLVFAIYNYEREG